MTQVSGRAGDTGERPRDTGELVANVSRPQHVAVLSDHQARRVDQLRRTDPAHTSASDSK